jgi:hypothetical protein
MSHAQIEEVFQISCMCASAHNVQCSCDNFGRNMPRRISVTKLKRIMDGGGVAGRLKRDEA